MEDTRSVDDGDGLVAREKDLVRSKVSIGTTGLELQVGADGSAKSSDADKGRRRTLVTSLSFQPRDS